jgi:hypothetical protein
MNIEPDKIYTARQVAMLGFIKNTKGKNDYNFVLDLINGGVLKTLPELLDGKRPFYRVLGRDIIEYKRVYEGNQEL